MCTKLWLKHVLFVATSSARGHMNRNSKKEAGVWHAIVLLQDSICRQNDVQYASYFVRDQKPKRINFGVHKENIFVDLLQTIIFHKFYVYNTSVLVCNMNIWSLECFWKMLRNHLFPHHAFFSFWNCDKFNSCRLTPTHDNRVKSSWGNA